jgi:hypothetical protein
MPMNEIFTNYRIAVGRLSGRRDGDSCNVRNNVLKLAKWVSERFLALAKAASKSVRSLVLFKIIKRGRYDV